MDDRELVATTVISRAAGIRRRMDGTTMRCQEEPKTCPEQENESVRGRGGSRQGLKHIDGDVPWCMRRKAKENEVKSKENVKSSSSRAKCDGGRKKDDKNVESENKGTSSSSSTKANKTSSERKREKDIAFIVQQKNVRLLNSSERFGELTQEVEGCRWDAINQ